MQKEKLIRVFKLIVILLLGMAITLLGLVQWKSDAIMMKVIASLQAELQDSLVYKSVHMDAFAHFPCISLRLNNARMGEPESPLIDHAQIDMVFGLLPLLKNKFDLHRVMVTDAMIKVMFKNGKWSYAILKKREKEKEGKPWSTTIQELRIQNSRLQYDDGRDLQFEMSFDESTANGKIDTASLVLEMDMKAAFIQLKTRDYVLPAELPFQFNGEFDYDFKTEIKQLKHWNARAGDAMLNADGTIQSTREGDLLQITGDWKKAKPDLLIKWAPADLQKKWGTYDFSGVSEGSFQIKGLSNAKSNPALTLNGQIQNAGITLKDKNETFQNLDLDFEYQSGVSAHTSAPSFKLNLNKKSTFGHDLAARLEIVNISHPLLNLDLDGQIPLTLLNLMAAPSLEVESGKADFDHFRLHQFDWRRDVLQQWLKSGKPDFTIEDLKCTYLGNTIACTSGTIHSSGEGAAQFAVKDLAWNKAAVRSVKGEIKNASPDQWDFSFGGEMSGGKIESKGFIRSTNQSHVWQADWTIKDIDMRDVMTSFSDFDQTFITADNLSGKADIWATTTIPMDAAWKIQTKQVFAEAALDIRDGRIKNLKTLEDFSNYVHIEDLRDIRFSELRNYLKIENGQVFLPVMFIQSSAMNLSVSGVHAFDQKILYHLKINAGQTLANKFRKTDFRKEMKPARKSGWINLYFVLEGTTVDVKYQQYRQAVLSGFEQSAKLKETLRKSLTDRFGYDVYWLEPNEWEEIPEYK